jgi:ATP-dependent RNA helicase RhlE
LENHASAFTTLGLSPSALEAIARAGYADPTPIQRDAIPPGLAGRDVIGCAATGTGKTAAYLLPIIERLAGRDGARTGSLALVLAPTRELVQQIGEQFALFSRGRGLRAAEIIGGVGFGPQFDALAHRPHVVIATPGRLIDHLQRGTARIDGIEVLVLDEADRMLDMGFRPQLDRILARVPQKRQTLLFSATIGGEVGEFARRNVRDPVRVEVSRSGTVAERAEQVAYLVAQNDKPALLAALLARDEASTLVFTRTRRRADRVARVLERQGHRTAAIHADRSQSQRKRALDAFKDGKVRVLVATDIAARGLDVEEIGHVVNFDLSHVPEDYVHRVGRTARASAAGRASSFVAPEEMSLLRDVERFTRASIARAPLPDGMTTAMPPPAWPAPQGPGTNLPRAARSRRLGGARPGAVRFYRP